MAVTVDGTVVEEEKVDLEIPQEKVDVKKADEAEPVHLLLPEDRVLDEEKEHYPRAFSDGEIAYET